MQQQHAQSDRERKREWKNARKTAEKNDITLRKKNFLLVIINKKMNLNKDTPSIRHRHFYIYLHISTILSYFHCLCVHLDFIWRFFFSSYNSRRYIFFSIAYALAHLVRDNDNDNCWNEQNTQRGQQRARRRKKKQIRELTGLCTRSGCIYLKLNVF